MSDKEPNLVRRIDRNTVCGSSEELLEMVMKDKNTSHYLYRIGGTAVGVVTGQSKFGEWVKLVGRFKAINSKGEQFVSGTAFLPGDAAQTVANKLDGDVEKVSFLFDVYARFDATIGPKYGYIIEPVRGAQEGDELDLLFNEAKAAPALENKSKGK